MRKIFTKGRAILAGGILLLAGAVAATNAVLGNSSSASAASSCDKVNIIYCGINGGSLSEDIKQMKNRYDSDTSGHSASPTVKKNYTDVREVMNWAGASKSLVDASTTSNTKLGTMYRNGNIEVDGKVVATDAWVSARFNGGSGFVHIEGNVYARKTTTSLAESSAKVLVRFDSNGNMLFAVMVDCGNAVKATPKKAPPKPTLACTGLTASHASADNRTFTFKATAHATNTKITNYHFNFGDGVKGDVNTSSETATITHTYATAGTYNVAVDVDSTDIKNVMSDACRAQAKITVTPALVCNSLTKATTANDNEYKFTASATPTNTTITNYVFDFGDGSTKVTNATAATSNTATHTYAKPGTYTATVAVNSKDKTNVTSAACKTTITIQAESTLVCDSLTKDQVADSDQYNFVAKATPSNTTITGYVFDFGDGAKSTVTTGNTSATTSHTYTTPGTYTATVAVNSTDKQNVTSSNCAVTINVKTPECKPGVPVGSPECTPATTQCVSLSKTADSANKFHYSFKVVGSATNATVKNYSVDFGDGTVAYTGTGDTVDHTYANAGNYTVTAKVAFDVDGVEVVKTSDDCVTQITINQEMCKIPGKEQYPVGDEHCATPTCTAPNGQKYPVGSSQCQLPNTGAGNVIGLFAGVSMAGAIAHRIFGNRRLNSSAL